MRLLLFCSLLLLSFLVRGQNQRVLTIYENVSFYNISKGSSFINDDEGLLTINQVSSDSFAGRFIPLKNKLFERKTGVKWIKLSIKSELLKDEIWYINFPVIDDVIFYSPSDKAHNKFEIEHTGQLMPKDQKPIKAGPYPFVKCEVKKGTQHTFYIRLASHTSNYAQLADLYLNRFIIYSPKAFNEQFGKVHIYNALFFGALLIMIFYNFMIYISLKDKAYLLYVIFGCAMGLLIAASSGYTYEFVFYDYPLIDSYVKFFSTRIIMVTYLIFSFNYLKVNVHLPKWQLAFKIFILLFFILFILDLSGQWFVVYNSGYILILFALIFVLVAAIKTFRKGYQPALYFIVANVLLVLAGILNNLYMIGIIPHIPITKPIEHGIKIAAVVELALFSLGLASKFNLIRIELAQKDLEKERQQQKVVEEKNKELEVKVIERTAEIKQQQKKIEEANLILEKKVKERTIQLNKAYRELLSINKELDLFIYKSSHDLKGPILTLLGLCHLGKLETLDAKAIEYLERLENSAQNMNNLLAKLIKTYEIKEKAVDSTSIDIKEMVEAIVNSLWNGNKSSIKFNIEIDEDIKYESDPLLIYILLENLIENTVVFTDTSKKESFVNITAGLTKSSLKINIKDNGIGIPKEAKNEIFNMFYKGTEISKGSGLGLYQAKLITRKLNGRIKIIEFDNTGFTEFEILLPIAA